MLTEKLKLTNSAASKIPSTIPPRNEPQFRPVRSLGMDIYLFINGSFSVIISVIQFKIVRVGCGHLRKNNFRFKIIILAWIYDTHIGPPSQCYVPARRLCQTNTSKSCSIWSTRSAAIESRAWQLFLSRALTQRVSDPHCNRHRQVWSDN